MKFDIWVFFENLSRKFKFHWNRTRITGTLHEDQYTTLTISRSFLHRMKNVSAISCRENQNIHFALNNFFFSGNRAVYEIMWKNIVERGRPQTTPRGLQIDFQAALLSNCNSISTKAPQCYVILTLHLLFLEYKCRQGKKKYTIGSHKRTLFIPQTEFTSECYNLFLSLCWIADVRNKALNIWAIHRQECWHHLSVGYKCLLLAYGRQSPLSTHVRVSKSYFSLCRTALYWL